nr:hypothetical protein JG4_0150 [uncultured bacterium]
MIEENSRNPDRSAARSVLKKITIAFAMFLGLLLVIGLGMGMYVSFLLHTPKPEMFLKIEAERAVQSRIVAGASAVTKIDGVRNEGLASASESTSNSLKSNVPTVSGEPTSVLAAGHTSGTLNRRTEPLFPLRSGLTTQQRQEQERLNAVYQHCLAGLDECKLWDKFNYHERETKLSEIFKILQANVGLMAKQADIEDAWRVKKYGIENQEAYHAILRIYDQYNGLLNIHHRLSLENAVRHQEWYKAARRSDSRVIDPDMIYYFRRVNTNGFIKFAWITGTICDRGLNSLSRLLRSRP